MPRKARFRSSRYCEDGCRGASVHLLYTFFSFLVRERCSVNIAGGVLTADRNTSEESVTILSSWSFRSVLRCLGKNIFCREKPRQSKSRGKKEKIFCVEKLRFHSIAMLSPFTDTTHAYQPKSKLVCSLPTFIFFLHKFLQCGVEHGEKCCNGWNTG